MVGALVLSSHFPNLDTGGHGHDRIERLRIGAALFVRLSHTAGQALRLNLGDLTAHKREKEYATAAKGSVGG